MEHKFLPYVTIIQIGLALLATFLAASLYTSFFDASAILVGAVWGSLNLYFLKSLLGELLKLDSRDALKFYILAGIKFPLLYLIGFFLLKSALFPVLYLVIGFTLTFIAIFVFGIGVIVENKWRANKGSKYYEP